MPRPSSTVPTAGKSIVFSGLTVMLGLSVMLLYDLMLVRSIAMGMLLVAGLAVLGAVTLLPALMCLFGRQVNSFNLIPWRKPGAQRAVGTGAWHAWSLLVMRYPWLFLILSMAILLAMSWPAEEMNAIGAGGPQGVGKEAESRKGFELLSHGLPDGRGRADLDHHQDEQDGWRVRSDEPRRAVGRMTEGLRRRQTGWPASSRSRTSTRT